MTLDVLNEKGTPLDQQRFTWRELAGTPYSKLDDDAYTRIRVILMNGIESEALRFSHGCARMNKDLQKHLARVRRVEQHQQTMVNWLNPPDQSALETTIGFEQVAIEVTASVAQNEPDEYLAQVYRFGLLEDFDHLYRYSALMDRVDGKDSNSILQSYTDILPGRPTSIEHRHPDDDLRQHYDRAKADPLSKINALTITAGEFQTHDYYMNIGPSFSDPIARALYAEIASIEEQHVTQYESLCDPFEPWLEKWLLHELTEVYNYWCCSQTESNARLKSLWTRFLDYEIGQLHYVINLMQDIEKRDPSELIPSTMPAPISYESQRDFVRDVLSEEVELSAKGTEFVPRSEESRETQDYRQHLNSEGEPSEIIAEGYVHAPGTELARHASTLNLADLFPHRTH